jgi:hypothetical protein
MAGVWSFHAVTGEGGVAAAEVDMETWVVVVAAAARGDAMSVVKLVILQGTAGCVRVPLEVEGNVNISCSAPA